jgi:hypothetical protein
MTRGERRQTGRIIRNGREVERRLFQVIEDLQAARHFESDDPERAFDWEEVLEGLRAVEDGVVVLFDLVRNIKAEQPRDQRPF